MTREESARHAGRIRAQRMRSNQRTATAIRANVTRAILFGLGKSDGRPSTSPFERPYRVVGSERS